MSQKPFHQSRRKTNYLAITIGVGVILGAGLGVALGNVDLGIAIGMMLGAAIGTLLNRFIASS